MVIQKLFSLNISFTSKHLQQTKNKIEVLNEQYNFVNP